MTEAEKIKYLQEQLKDIQELQGFKEWLKKTHKTDFQLIESAIGFLEKTWNNDNDYKKACELYANIYKRTFDKYLKKIKGGKNV